MRRTCAGRASARSRGPAAHGPRHRLRGQRVEHPRLSRRPRLQRTGPDESARDRRVLPAPDARVRRAPAPSPCCRAAGSRAAISRRSSSRGRCPATPTCSWSAAHPRGRHRGHRAHPPAPHRDARPGQGGAAGLGGARRDHVPERSDPHDVRRRDRGRIAGRRGDGAGVGGDDGRRSAPAPHPALAAPPLTPRRRTAPSDDGHGRSRRRSVAMDRRSRSCPW